MELTLNDQLSIFIYSLVPGVLMGVINDIFSFCRYLGFSNKRAFFIQDISFMIICSLITFLFAAGYNNGEVRFFIILGCALGFAAYRFSVGILTRKVFYVFSFVLKNIYKFIIGSIRWNICIIFKIFTPLFNFNWIKRKKLIKVKKKSCN